MNNRITRVRRNGFACGTGLACLYVLADTISKLIVGGAA